MVINTVQGTDYNERAKSLVKKLPRACYFLSNGGQRIMWQLRQFWIRQGQNLETTVARISWFLRGSVTVRKAVTRIKRSPIHWLIPHMVIMVTTRPNWSQQLGPSSKYLTWVAGPPSTWTIFSCLPRDNSRELDRNWSSWGYNWYSNIEMPAS